MQAVHCFISTVATCDQFEQISLEINNTNLFGKSSPIFVRSTFFKVIPSLSLKIAWNPPQLVKQNWVRHLASTIHSIRLRDDSYSGSALRVYSNEPSPEFKIL